MPIAPIDLFWNALLCLFTLSAERYIPLLTSPRINVKGWKGEKVKGGKQHIKSKKTSNIVDLSLYWNVLSCSFTIIECSLDISFWVAMQHTSPLAKGRKREDYLYRTDIILNANARALAIFSPFHFFTLSPLYVIACPFTSSLFHL